MKHGLAAIPLNTVQVFLLTENLELLPSGTRSVLDLLSPHKDEENFTPPPISDSLVLPAAIVSSSGTTGPCKGVVLTHASITCELVKNYNKIFSGNRRDSFLCFSSLYWITGLSTLYRTTKENILRVITTQPFTPELLPEIVKKHRVTILLTAPLQLATILRQPLNPDDFDSLNFWLCGGAHVPEENCLKMNSYLRNGHMVIAYSCSEIGGLISKTIDNYKSVGTLSRGISVRGVRFACRQSSP